MVGILNKPRNLCLSQRPPLYTETVPLDFDNVHIGNVECYCYYIFSLLKSWYIVRDGRRIVIKTHVEDMEIGSNKPLIKIMCDDCQLEDIVDACDLPIQ